MLRNGKKIQNNVSRTLQRASYKPANLQTHPRNQQQLGHCPMVHNVPHATLWPPQHNALVPEGKETSVTAHPYIPRLSMNYTKSREGSTPAFQTTPLFFPVLSTLQISHFPLSGRCAVTSVGLRHFSLFNFPPSNTLPQVRNVCLHGFFHTERPLWSCGLMMPLT